MISGDYTFANEFREKFITYCKSQGQDQAAYNWLMRNSNRMQTGMGECGIYGSYKPPFANYAYKNYPIILNMLPELRRYIEPDFGSPLNAKQVNSFMRAIDEALLRYIGVMEEWRSRFRKQLLNPFLWLREGVGQILSVPLLLLTWGGIMGAVTVDRIQASGIFKAFSALGGLISLIGSGMTILLGWGETVKLLKAFLAGS